MSRITFNTKCGEDVYLRGPERYHMSYIINGIFEGLLPVDVEEMKAFFPEDSFSDYFARYEALIATEQYREAGNMKRWLQDSVKLHIRSGFNVKLKTRENGLQDAWILQLNTAMSLGGDPLRLFVKLHGQCEVHCWVAESNREWLASVIEEGREMGLYRADMGWEKIIALLRNTEAPGPVVTDFSVCDSFPHLPAPDAEDDYAPHDWDVSFAALQGAGLEISPEAFKNDYFGVNCTVFDLARPSDHESL